MMKQTHHYLKGVSYVDYLLIFNFEGGKCILSSLLLLIHSHLDKFSFDNISKYLFLLDRTFQIQTNLITNCYQVMVVLMETPVLTENVLSPFFVYKITHNKLHINMCVVRNSYGFFNRNRHIYISTLKM